MTTTPHREAGNAPASRSIDRLQITYDEPASRGHVRALWRAVARNGWSSCDPRGHKGHISPQAARYCFLTYIQGLKP